VRRRISLDYASVWRGRYLLKKTKHFKSSFHGIGGLKIKGGSVCVKTLSNSGHVSTEDGTETLRHSE